jgi:hypothetical protein
VGFAQHVFQIGKQQGLIQAELSGVFRGELLVRLSDSDDLNVGPVQGVLEKTLDVPVRHSRDRDANWSSIGGGLGVSNR